MSNSENTNRTTSLTIVSASSRLSPRGAEIRSNSRNFFFAEQKTCDFQELDIGRGKEARRAHHFVCEKRLAAKFKSLRNLKRSCRFRGFRSPLRISLDRSGVLLFSNGRRRCGVSGVRESKLIPSRLNAADCIKAPD